MKLNFLVVCLISGLTPIFGAPGMEKRAAANSLDTSPATKGNGDVLADGKDQFFLSSPHNVISSVFVKILWN
ncbi:hypothetical protein AJ78_01782 [Emergomyces pasteurianus Ep9510]|uniref:Uncharacterized protein n=1 Tax=Emergomyces pasteurianus Ep9510 TaxID=1447872 RepID=A0A1J9PQJ4_9EURO|nr:hypothetical protein AJ78_01782 [Emergomyces pasteurianus Ep9510]